MKNCKVSCLIKIPSPRFTLLKLFCDRMRNPICRGKEVRDNCILFGVLWKKKHNSVECISFDPKIISMQGTHLYMMETNNSWNLLNEYCYDIVKILLLYKRAKITQKLNHCTCSFSIHCFFVL